MNTTAHDLQADDTFAATPDGLDATDQLTSAYDLALIARAAINAPGFVPYDQAPRVKLPSTRDPIGGINHDRLLPSFPGAFAGKDGYTTRAGQVWWGAARRGGHRLIVVLMDAGTSPVSQELTAALGLLGRPRYLTGRHTRCSPHGPRRAGSQAFCRAGGEGAPRRGWVWRARPRVSCGSGAGRRHRAPAAQAPRSPAFSADT